MTAPAPLADGERPPAAGALDVERLRASFPILAREVHGHRLVYLDNAASAQRPEAVIEAVSDCYRTYYANAHRGVHALSERSTDEYEAARGKVARFVGASKSSEIVFTRGTTESLNLVAQSYARPLLGPGDEVLLTEMEHHSNIVPWQLVCEQTGARVRAAPITDDGDVDLDAFARMVNERTRVVALAHVSNALGTVNDVAAVARLVRDRSGAAVVVDGAQAVPHMKVDVSALDCDFYAFSGHKMYGPGGIGALWGRGKLLASMPPYHGGGAMITRVTFERTEYTVPPHRFEAGTPSIAPAIGLGVAIEFLESVGLDRIERHEHALLSHTVEVLNDLPWVRVLGQGAEAGSPRAAVVSLVVDGAHPHDVATILDEQGVAIRAGHHCAQPLMERLGVPATVRASFGLYNTHEEVDLLVSGLHEVRRIFG
ncbi:MAG: cysteine desulfurase [Holophagales bacterium]|nr:cysteine desulfurase [Holophagales bacterium]MYD23987.1 cysteine desulfurase [Holophagales bacterium]MYI33460.1 cysteine desulfurase [Holophagales bacterium]